MNSILAPFTYIIHTIFEIAFQITGNYGVSVILLSFVISLLLLPIFIYIEKAKKRDDVLKNRMQPLIDEIKQVYSGQERFYYLKTLNRQFGYSQFKALIPILSLLVQIPFFIAAYQYLNTLEPLEGVSFGPLAELSEPDGLLGVVNVLPILMTIINLITVYFYSREGSKSERIQMSVVAGIFLVLLFNLPSGLVLYWTINNVFAFLRLFITNREVFKGRHTLNFEMKKTLTSIYIVSVSILSVGQINWAINHGFASLHIRILLSGIASFILVSGIALFWKAHRNKFFIQLKNCFKHFYTFLTLGTITGWFFQFNWAINHTFDGIILRLIAVAIGAPLAITALLLLYCFAQSMLKQILLKWLSISVYAIFITVPLYFFLSSILYYEKSSQTLMYISAIFLVPAQVLGLLRVLVEVVKKKTSAKTIFLVPLLFLLGIQYINLTAYLGNTEYKFDLLGINIASHVDSLKNLIISGILFSLISTIFFPFPKSVKTGGHQKSYTLVFGLSVLFLVTNTLLWNPIRVFSSFPEAYVFSSYHIFAQNIKYVIVALVLLGSLYLAVNKPIKNTFSKLALIITANAFYQNMINPVDTGTLQLNKFSSAADLAFPVSTYITEYLILLLIVLGVFQLFKRNYFKPIIFALIVLNVVVVGQSVYSGIQKGSFSSRTKNNSRTGNKIYFSKKENNIVYLVLDMFQGIHLQKILDEQPGLNEVFSGFVNYDNTLAISRVTNTSIAPMVGGFDYDPALLNKNKTLQNKEKVTGAFERLFSKLKKQEFSITTNKYPYTQLDSSFYDVFLPPWQPEWDIWAKNGVATSGGFFGVNVLTNNSLFHSVPRFLKPEVYNNGNWLMNEKGLQSSSRYLNYYRFLDMLPKISSVSSKEKCFTTLYYFNTHFPWNKLGNNGKVVKNVSPYENQKWAINELVEWIEWMKKNKVYDNTRIIIASDHGVHWRRFNEEIDFSAYIKHPNEKVISNDLLMTFNSLLFVKDYKASGKVRSNNTLMSNADIPQIILHDGPIESMPFSDNRTLKCYESYWSKDMDTRTQFHIAKTFEVKKDIFNGDNWTRLK